MVLGVGVAAEHLPAATRQVRQDRSQEGLPDGDPHPVHRFQHTDVALRRGFAQRQGARGLEGHVGGVDGVGLAVVEGDGEVHHREAEQGALGHLGLDSLVHRPDELARHGAAHHLVDELVARPAFEGGDLDLADRVLAVATRLFHVASLGLRGGGEGFPQRYLHGHLVDVQAVALPQPRQQQLLVCLTHSPQQLLVGFGVTFQADGDVLDGQPLQRPAELVLVAPGVGLDGDGQQRLRNPPGPDRARTLRGGQGIPGLGLGQARHVDDLARDGLVLAHQLQADRS